MISKQKCSNYPWIGFPICNPFNRENHINFHHGILGPYSRRTGSFVPGSNLWINSDCHPVLISWSHAADVDRSISHHLRHVAVLWARRFSGCSFSPPEHQRSSSVPCRTSSQFPTEYPTEYSSSANEERIIIVSVHLCLISLAWARDE